MGERYHLCSQLYMEGDFRQQSWPVDAGFGLLPSVMTNLSY